MIDQTINSDCFATHLRPELAELLQAIGLNIVYERGEGDYLFYRDEAGREVKVLDLLGGFGVSLFGHNHPELVATAYGVLTRQRPFVSQGSIRGLAGMLGRRLSDLVAATTGQDYVVTLANSGAEAVEAALKHAAWEKVTQVDAILAGIERTFREIRVLQREGKVQIPTSLFTTATTLLNSPPLETLRELQFHLRQHNQLALSQGHCYLAIKGAFHGKTTGALQLTYNPDFRLPWQHLGIKALFTRLNDTSALASRLEKQRSTYLDLILTPDGDIRLVTKPWSNVIACLAEPILGEGGIHPLTTEFLQALRTAADAENFPLILDEIQSGMGRTGTFLASEPSGVTGDYYLFSKALGGGLAKISALLVSRDRYIKRFGYIHTSTFADDDFSSAIALQALELVCDGGLIEKCQQSGQYLLTQLETLQRQYPTVIKEVRGRGLLIGIELAELTHAPSMLLQIAAQQHLLGFLLCGYLLHEHQIRVTPTISATNTIRIEPSALITTADIDRFCRALACGIRLIAEGHTHQFVHFLTGAGEREDRPAIISSPPAQSPPVPLPIGRKVACLVHFLEPEDLLKFDPTLMPLTADQCSHLLAQTQLVLDPFVVGEQTIYAPMGDAVHLTLIGIPYTSAQIAARQRANELGPVLEVLEKGMSMAKGLGCTVVGMTGYTSIVSGNCTHFIEDELALTSGNSLTVATAVTAIQQLTTEMDINVLTTQLAVVGSAGNIGTVLVEIFLDTFPNLLLIGRKGAESRLNRLAQQLTRKNPKATIGISTDLADLASCQIIVTVTNAPEPIIHPQHIGNQTKIVCDIAVPGDVAPNLATAYPQVQVVQGGLFRLPNGQSWQISCMPLAQGETYACVVETLLLGLTGICTNFSYGALEATKVRQIQKLAQQHQFKLII